jgi:hypothetical protein
MASSVPGSRARRLLALCSLLAPTVAGQAVADPGVSFYTVPAGFPTALFSSYYVPPSPTQEPQPVIYDPVLNITYPLNLTDPNTLPAADGDPVYYPRPVAEISNASAEAFVRDALLQIKEIVSGAGGVSGNCSKCVAALNIGKLVAQVAPTRVPDALVGLCQSTGFASNSSCATTYAAGAYGAIWTQVLAFADVSGLDGLYICSSLSTTFCPLPPATPLNTTGLFPKAKPANARAPAASGQTLKVLHLSDLHLDPRYAVGSEANCSSRFCCRTDTPTATGQTPLPAPLYGAFECDTPYDLATAALQSVGPLTGVEGNDSFAWTIYTGDLVSHDPLNQLSRAYLEYAETGVYGLLKKYIRGPVFAALGNHDTNPEALEGPHSLPGPLGQQFGWNYDHVAGLWQHDGWIDGAAAAEARLHYGAYSTKTPFGLRVITLNTDFWYRSNILNFINTTNPDSSGMLAFLIEELQQAEDAGERVWILGHVLAGWDGNNGLSNPTDLFYQIVTRYSPHVIAEIFWGHTHEDEFNVFYANNGTAPSRASALATAWIGPSITPLTNLNSGFRLYAVDRASFSVHNAWTYFADVSSFPALSPAAHGPVFRLEYSTRDAYPVAGGWPADAPLNATWWHAVTEAMEADASGALLSRFNTFEGKSSVLSPACVTAGCRAAKVCYMRSGSSPLGRACPRGWVRPIPFFHRPG